MKTFIWSCNFNGLEAQGVGRSKKDAKLAAAKSLKEQLDLDSLPQPVEKKRKTPATPQQSQQFHKKKKLHEFPPRQFPPNFGNFFPGPPGPPGPDGFFADIQGDEGAAALEPAPRGPPMNFGYGGGPVFCSRLSKLDRYVIRKHKDIYPTEPELNLLLGLIRDVEEVMRLVAKAIDKKNEEAGAEANSDKSVLYFLFFLPLLEDVPSVGTFSAADRESTESSNSAYRHRKPLKAYPCYGYRTCCMSVEILSPGKRITKGF